MRDRASLIVLLAAASMCPWSGGALAQDKAAQPKDKSPETSSLPEPEKPAARTAKAIFESVAESGDISAATRELEAIIKATATAKDATGIAELESAAMYRRLVRHVERLSEPTKAKDRLAWLSRNPRTAASLAWTLRASKDSGSDDIVGAYAVLDKLVEAGGSTKAGVAATEVFPELAAALCAVYDRPPQSSVENRATPGELFRYYVARDKQLVFAASNLPATLLMHIVDTRSSVAELDWAFKQVRGDRQVGRHYRDIEYDTEYFKQGKQKRLEGKPYTLQNIRQWGGVCVEQAYYAEHLGKAIGVPTASVTGRSSGVGHAWVGYMISASRNLSFEFREGKYEEFKGVQGRIEDPQGGAPLTEGELSMKAELAEGGTLRARRSLSLLDAAEVMTNGNWNDLSKDTMGLLEESVNAAPFQPDAWRRVAELGRSKRLDVGQTKRWCESAAKFCGNQYPDFAMDIIEPLIASLSDVAMVDATWSWAQSALVESQRDRRYYRWDLWGEMMIKRAEAWEKAGKPQRTWELYQEIIKRCADESPVMVVACDRSGKLMADNNSNSAAIEREWKTWWSMTRKPINGNPNFLMATNWAQVGLRYAAALDKMGKRGQAEDVRRQILPKSKN